MIFYLFFVCPFRLLNLLFTAIILFTVLLFYFPFLFSFFFLSSSSFSSCPSATYSATLFMLLPFHFFLFSSFFLFQLILVATFYSFLPFKLTLVVTFHMSFSPLKSTLHCNPFSFSSFHHVLLSLHCTPFFPLFFLFLFPHYLHASSLFIPLFILSSLSSI